MFHGRNQIYAAIVTTFKIELNNNSVETSSSSLSWHIEGVSLERREEICGEARSVLSNASRREFSFLSVTGRIVSSCVSLDINFLFSAQVNQTTALNGVSYCWLRRFQVRYLQLFFGKFYEVEGFPRRRDETTRNHAQTHVYFKNIERAPLNPDKISVISFRNLTHDFMFHRFS